MGIMKLTELEAKAIKAIYSDYHAGDTSAEDTLHALEQLLNGAEACPTCSAIITDDNPLIDETRYSTAFGACIGCCDPTP